MLLALHSTSCLGQYKPATPWCRLSRLASMLAIAILLPLVLTSDSTATKDQGRHYLERAPPQFYLILTYKLLFTTHGSRFKIFSVAFVELHNQCLCHGLLRPEKGMSLLIVHKGKLLLTSPPERPMPSPPSSWETAVVKTVCSYCCLRHHRPIIVASWPSTSFLTWRKKRDHRSTFSLGGLRERSLNGRLIKI